MAEFVEKRCEEMIPELEQMEKIKLLDEKEIREIAKKRKAYEYRIQRHTKCKEDYIGYIQYEMNLLKLIKQRRDKFGITTKKSAIDFSITQRVNDLYKQAIFKFQDDIRFWTAHIKFCKNAQLKSCLNGMIARMLQVHQDKPKCWHIAAMYEKEENESTPNARQFLFNGLKIHQDSQLLFTDLIKLELQAAVEVENGETEETQETEAATEEKEIISKNLKRVHVVYQHALDRVKDVQFFIELLNIMKDFENTDRLQEIMLTDLMTHFGHEPSVWDLMARRELEGSLPRPFLSKVQMDVDDLEPKSLRERIASCNEVYQEAVKRIKTEEMWSFYVQCMIEMNLSADTLPNYRKKLLKTALLQGHQARKLSEKYYLYWIQMLSSDKKDESANKKVYEILSWATEALPNSAKLWNERLKYLLSIDHKDAVEIFEKAKKILGPKALPLWKTNLLFIKSQSPEKLEEFYQVALRADPAIANAMKSNYILWLVVTKGIQAARDVYKKLGLEPPFCLQLHQTMIDMELAQPVIEQNYVRDAYEKAVIQFGKSNVDLWKNYLNFEMKDGDIKKIGALYNRTLKTLDAALTDQFIADYSLMKANFGSSDKKNSFELMDTSL